VPSSSVSDPERTLATDDPGDDTARRFVYQWTYAAILCCGMFDNTVDLVEVFCEHHEDVLLKHSDGTFTGCQVKTRRPERQPFKATDKEITGACKRFAQLEKQFPGRFRAFVIVTNHVFVTGKQTKTCLSYLLDLAATATDVDSAPQVLRQYLQLLATAASCEAAIALVALKKTRFDHGQPKLDDVLLRLIDTLTQVWPQAHDCTITIVNAAARALVSACQEASSLAHALTVPGYIAVSPNPAHAELQIRINGKRIDRAKLEQILGATLQGGELLHGPLTDLPELAMPNLSLLQQKLSAGGFSALAIASAAELRDKADFLGLQWIRRYGKTVGLQRYDHIRTLVRVDCADAFDTTRSDSEPFGRTMLADLRQRFRKRRSTSSGAPLFGCLDEHLEGYAYLLTAECSVWWSSDKPVQDK